MSKVTNLQADEVIDYCANPECGSEIHFGQAVWKVGHELVCCNDCLIKKLGAKALRAGRDQE